MFQSGFPKFNWMIYFVVTKNVKQAWRMNMRAIYKMNIPGDIPTGNKSILFFSGLQFGFALTNFSLNSFFRYQRCFAKAFLYWSASDNDIFKVLAIN